MDGRRVGLTLTHLTPAQLMELTLFSATRRYKCHQNKVKVMGLGRNISFVPTTTYLGIILHIYPSAKLDLAVLDFGTIGPVDGWEAIGSPTMRSAPNTVNHYPATTLWTPQFGVLCLSVLFCSVFFSFSMDYFWLTVTLDVLRGIGHNCYLSVFS